jgi:succinoglycan biosynthesis protein ExoA
MKPKVSLLVSMRNEARNIEKCLTSIFSQDYPVDRLEVWVLDGNSSDSSWGIVEQLFRARQNCHLLPNPKIFQAAGWNLGIEQATGDIVGIVSAHSELEADYVSTAVETLERTGADMVGGPMRAIGKGLVGRAVAVATSTPFGVGSARFHYTEREEEVDTVYMGLCWRRVYEQIGGFDEELVRDQDDELSYRLRSSGGRIFCNPAIRSRYYNRPTFRTLWRQYFEYGCWKVRVMQKHVRQMRKRHFVPATFVAVLVLAGLCSTFSLFARYFLAATLLLYILANAGASLWAVRRSGSRRLLPLLPVTFGILHISYGLGFLVGLGKFRGRWGDRHTDHRGLGDLIAVDAKTSKP